MCLFIVRLQFDAYRSLLIVLYCRWSGKLEMMEQRVLAGLGKNIAEFTLQVRRVVCTVYPPPPLPSLNPPHIVGKAYETVTHSLFRKIVKSFLNKKVSIGTGTSAKQHLVSM